MVRLDLYRPSGRTLLYRGLDDTESLAGDDREVQIKLRIKIGCPRVTVSFKYFPAVRELTSSLKYSPTSLQTS